MLSLGNTETQLKPKLFKKGLIHHIIWQRGKLFSYNILLLRYLNFKYLLPQAQMVAYKTFYPTEIEADFLKTESRDFLQSKNQKWPMIIFFWGRIPHWPDLKEYKAGFNICQSKLQTTRTRIYRFLFCESQILYYCLKHSDQPLKKS